MFVDFGGSMKVRKRKQASWSLHSTFAKLAPSSHRAREMRVILGPECSALAVLLFGPRLAFGRQIQDIIGKPRGIALAYFLHLARLRSASSTVPYALSVQNEPENSNGNYSTCSTPATMAQVETAARTLMNNNGYSGVKLLGYDHNWDHAAEYPVQLMQQAGDSFNGVQFHCYGGTCTQMADFVNAVINKEVQCSVLSARVRMSRIGGLTSRYLYLFMISHRRLPL
ncbi:hypothetical protein OF83DRAFT_1285855 [Amylostereum chailletii]|nr:hypothetical protein OF83DRAFT_1285855 [Amylostereum chailletii]